MRKKTIILIVILLAVIALGMISYAGLRSSELSRSQVFHYETEQTIIYEV